MPKLWELCEKCGGENVNRDWTSYCPTCRADYDKRHAALRAEEEAERKAAREYYRANHK